MFLFLFFFLNAHGQVPVAEYVSAQGLSMGGTGILSTDGAMDSLFYNPSAMAYVKNGFLNEITFISPFVSTGNNTENLYKSILEKTPPLDLAKNYQDKPLHLRIQNVTGISFKRLAIGILQMAQADFIIGSDPVTGSMNANAQVISRMGITMGFARPIYTNGKDSGVYLGVRAKLMEKFSGNISVSPQDFLTQKQTTPDWQKLAQSGLALGGDVGMLWNGGGETDARFALVLRDVGMHYKQPSHLTLASPAKAEPVTLDVGVGLQPHTQKSQLLWALEVKDVLNKTQTNIYTRIHMGARLEFARFLGIMGGFNQGYPTYGCYFNLRFLRAEIGNTMEETGSFPGELESNRMYGRISLGWSQ